MIKCPLRPNGLTMCDCLRDQCGFFDGTYFNQCGILSLVKTLVVVAGMIEE